ncbi:MAG: Calx-beta protein [Planctomycetaceae bacterium]|nr:Calx-beta protein [Planctomycetaceae bacterium]
MTWHDWMRRLPKFCDLRSRRRSRASYQSTGWRIESLEVRNLLTVNFQFDYSQDATHFFDNNALARASLEMAANSLESFLGDSLDAITPSGSNSWVAQYTSPGTGAAISASNLTVSQNSLLIFVGGRDLSGEVAEGAPGGWSSGSTDQQWLDLLGSRGQTGALAPGVATDFGPWGGSLAFDSSGTDWFFGTGGILPNQMDFMSAAQHELGHLLGFGTAESFDRYISGSTFAGPNSAGAYDGVGNPPLSGDRAHWLAGTTDGGQVVAMDPSLGPGVQRFFTGLDYAALNDIGWNSNNGTGTGDGGGGGGGTAGSVNVTAASNLQTSESGASVSFTAVLNTKPTSNVSFNLTNTNLDEAFLSASSLVFTPSNWNIPQTVTVTGVDDLAVDGNKSYKIITSPVVSSDGHFSGFDPVDVTITNLDNDQSGITVTPTTGLVTTEQGGTSSFVVYLNSQPSSNVTISVNSSDIKEGTVSLTTLVFTPTNWMISQIVTVTGVDDHVADSNKTYSIVLNPALSADPAYAGINPPDVRVISTSIPDLNPTILLSGSAVTVLSEGNPTLLDTNAQVYDLDSPFLNLNGARLVIGLSSNGTSNDKLSVLDEGKGSGKVGAPSGSSITYGGVAIGTRSGGSGTTPLTIIFNSKATMAMVQEVIRNLQFQTSTANKSALDRSVTFQLKTSDGTTSNTASKLIHVMTGAQPPVINLGTGTLTYKNKSGGQLISPTASLTDPDSALFTGGKLTVSMGPGAVVGDTLRIRRQGTGAGQIDAATDGTVKFGKTIIGTWSGGTNGKALVITFKSTASQAAVQALIRDITFETSLLNTSLTSRTVNFQVTDGKGGSSAVATKTIAVN